MAFKGCVGDNWIMVASCFLPSDVLCFFLRSSGSVTIDTLQIFEANLLTHHRSEMLRLYSVLKIMNNSIHDRRLCMQSCSAYIPQSSEPFQQLYRQLQYAITFHMHCLNRECARFSLHVFLTLRTWPHLQSFPTICNPSPPSANPAKLHSQARPGSAPSCGP